MTRCIARKFDGVDGETVLFLSAVGHADFGEHGKDIVCAAVSCLCLSFANAMCGIEDAEVESEVADGRFYFSAHIKERKEYAEGVFDMAVTGLKLIADQYPDHVSLKSGVSH